MTRLLHTADWHLGRPFFGVSLLADQEKVLADLVALARHEKVDAVVVAGDVFDRAVPPAEAVELLDRTLTALVEEAGCPVVLVAGNHDSPRRLDFGRDLVRPGGLVLVGTLPAAPRPLVLPDRWGEVEIWPLPFLEPGHAREVLGRPELTGADQAYGAAVERLEPGPRAVLVTHAFLNGGSPSESERPLVVGGGELVGPERFAPFAYTALGHLHRPQSLGPEGRLRYSGSLLHYSFDEVDQVKGVTLVEIEKEGVTRCEHLPLPPTRPLVVLEGTLANLLERGTEAGGDDRFALVRLHDRGPVLNAADRLRTLYPNLLHVERELPEGGEAAPGPTAAHLDLDDRTLFRSFFTGVTGEDLEADEEAFLETTVADLERRRREERS